MKNYKIFHKIYLTSRNELSRFISRLVPPHEIEDIVQETYVRICKVDNAKNINSPKSFMFKTARNLALDYLKQANVKLVDHVDTHLELEHLLSDQSKDEMYENALIDNEFAHFCDVVRQLPLQCRKVFVLKKVYGFSQKEIANELQISTSTVEKHITSGMLRCTLYMRKMKSLTHKIINQTPENVAGTSHE